jgi:hypothetical protein
LPANEAAYDMMTGAPLKAEARAAHGRVARMKVAGINTGDEQVAPDQEVVVTNSSSIAASAVRATPPCCRAGGISRGCRF